MPCVKIQASTPYQKLEVLESGSTLHQLCIMVASVASCLQKIELCFQALDYRLMIVISVVLYMRLQVNEELSRLNFSHSGFEVGRPAFQLPMFQKCDSLPKKGFVRVCLRHPFPPFLFYKDIQLVRRSESPQG